MTSVLSQVSLKNSAQVEMVQTEEEIRSAGWADGRPFLQEQSISQGTSVRVLNKGGQGVVTTRQSSSDALLKLIEKAHLLSDSSPRDAHRALWDGARRDPAPVAFDTQLFQPSIEDLLHPLKELESEILKIDKRIKKVVKMELALEKDGFSIENTLGLKKQKQSTSASFTVEILAEESGRSEVAWDMIDARFFNDLDFKPVALDAARQSVRALGGKAMASGTYPVLVHPRVGVQFLDLLSDALSAEEVHLGRSFLKGKLNQAVANDAVTLMDDPLLPSASGSDPFDDEGVPHQTMAVVEKGILKTYFYDLRSAKRSNVAPTGHGVKESLGSAPSPGASNFYLQPGKADPSSLLKSEKRVFLLRDVMGLHMADPMTGEFSLGASGDLYENGKFVHPVRGVTIAGQLSQVFKDISAVANDLRWYGSLGSPSFLIPQITVAGH